MKLIVQALWLALLATSARASDLRASNTCQAFDEDKTLSSAELKAVMAPLPILRKERPAWRDYRIDLDNDDNNYYVFFYQPSDDRAWAIQGAPDKDGDPWPPPIAIRHFYPNGLWVELRRSDFHVVRFYKNLTPEG